MSNSNYDNQAHLYALREISGGDYLVFRAISELAILKNLKILDVGCGAGRSTRFLRDLGNSVVGIDVSLAMLEQAKKFDAQGDYLLIEREKAFPFKDASFDVFFSSWVMLEQGSREKVAHILKESRRALRPGGKGIIIVNSQELYNGTWLSCEVDFPENKSLTSGQKVKVRLMPESVEIVEYFWSDADYRSFFKEAGFVLKQVYKPLGRSDDLMQWKDELRVAPFVIYLLQAGE